MYIGHLSVFHKMERATKCELCKEKIEVGQTYFLFRKTIGKANKKGKKIWINQGLHTGCVAEWLYQKIPIFEAREDGRKKNRPVVKGRAPTKFKDAITPNELIQRKQMMSRRAHLIRRLKGGVNRETQLQLVKEMSELEQKILLLGQYNTKYQTFAQGGVKNKWKKD